MTRMRTVTKQRLKRLGRELAEEWIARRKSNTESSSYSYLWDIPLGKINRDNSEVLEIKGGRKAILRAQKALSVAFKEDWIDIQLGKRE